MIDYSNAYLNPYRNPYLNPYLEPYANPYTHFLYTSYQDCSDILVRKVWHGAQKTFAWVVV